MVCAGGEGGVVGEDERVLHFDGYDLEVLLDVQWIVVSPSLDWQGGDGGSSGSRAGDREAVYACGVIKLVSSANGHHCEGGVALLEG